MRSTSWAAFAVVLAAAPAAASPCGERVAALEKRYEATTGAPPAVPPNLAGTAPETSGAKLHHQPTASSVAGAETSADSPEVVRRAKFQVFIEQARAADDSNDPKECEASANEAEKSLR